MLGARLTAATAVIAGLLSLCRAAQLTTVSDFGDNPSQITMAIYVPDTLPEKPAVIVLPHPCGGNSRDTFTRVATDLPALADDLGIILIYPATTHNSGCWDVRSAESLSHDGGGDSKGIINMVGYVLEKYDADPERVFSAGSSSGGMMTNVLLAVYPDVFAAGASFSGSPLGCWDGPSPSPLGGPSCPPRGQGYAAGQWGDLVRECYPDYEGAYPRMMVWHGTADYVVDYSNFKDQLDQWSDVLGVEFSRNVTGSPQSGYTEVVYGEGDRLVGYSAAGVGHMVPFHAKEVLEFFELM